MIDISILEFYMRAPSISIGVLRIRLRYLLGIHYVKWIASEDSDNVHDITIHFLFRKFDVMIPYTL